MRAGVVVVVMPPVTVVERRVVVRAVGAGVATAAEVAFVDALGWSGAAVFWTCDDAKAVMPPSEVSVIAVATPVRVR